MRFPKDQLVRMGTTVLAETADACLSAPSPIADRGCGWRLRWLYGLSDGPREPYVTFWKVCGIVDVKGERARAVAIGRYQAAWAAYREILAGLTDQNWPGGPEDATTLGRRTLAAARGPERPQRRATIRGWWRRLRAVGGCEGQSIVFISLNGLPCREPKGSFALHAIHSGKR